MRGHQLLLNSRITPIYGIVGKSGASIRATSFDPIGTST